MPAHEPDAPAVRARPNMPEYGISSKEEGLMSWEWVDEQMAKSRNYWIVSTRPDGSPHAAPVWGLWLEGRLYFGSAPSSRKARNFAHNPEIVVHLESGDETVIMEGRVRQETDQEVNRRVGALYAPKYAMPANEDPSPGGYFVFTPYTVFAWTEKDYPNTATRWTFKKPASA